MFSLKIDEVVCIVVVVFIAFLVIILFYDIKLFRLSSYYYFLTDSVEYFYLISVIEKFNNILLKLLTKYCRLFI